jgi:hypothetical protein
MDGIPGIGNWIKYRTGQQLFFNYKVSAILHSPTSQKTAKA